MKNTVLRLITLSAAAIFALCLTACSGGGEEGGGTDAPQSAAPIGTVAPVNTQGEDVTVPENDPDDPAPSTEEIPNTEAPDTQAPEETQETELTEKPETELSTAPAEETAPEAPIDTEPTNVSAPAAPTENAAAAVKTAEEQVGKPFKMGGASPEEGFDNSGIVYYALNHNGIACPRIAREMAEMGEKIGYDQLQPGDIAFFNMTDEAKTLFVGLYIGDGKIVISTDEDKPVSVADITTQWYRNAFAYGVAAGR